MLMRQGAVNAEGRPCRATSTTGRDRLRRGPCMCFTVKCNMTNGVAAHVAESAWAASTAQPFSSCFGS
jgi:hypothetical protein